MTEKQLVDSIVDKIQAAINSQKFSNNIFVGAGIKLPYAHEVLSYISRDFKEAKATNYEPYETDLLIYEKTNQDWKPRLIIEVKKGKLGSDGPLTYSQKASKHKVVHPYLRYGLLAIGLKDGCLPGRLVRHGICFDFMLYWDSPEISGKTFNALIDLISNEVETSQNLEEIIFNSRKQNRKQYRFLHRCLKLR